MSRTFEALQKAAKLQTTTQEKEARKTAAGQEAGGRAGGQGRESVPIIESRGVGHTWSLPQETFRTLRTNILSANEVGRCKVVLFASSTPREGTSTVLLNFARVLAAAGERVIMVDANFARPMLHHLGSVDERGGLTELLRLKQEPKDIMRSTKLNNVSVITCGTNGGPSCPMDSLAVDLIIDQMREMADWVLFDVSPLNGCNDAVSLGPKMDGVVLVVRAGKTRREVAQHAVHKLQNAGANLMGVVLNRRIMPIPEWIYRWL